MLCTIFLWFLFIFRLVLCSLFHKHSLISVFAIVRDWRKIEIWITLIIYIKKQQQTRTKSIHLLQCRIGFTVAVVLFTLLFLSFIYDKNVTFLFITVNNLELLEMYTVYACDKYKIFQKEVGWQRCKLLYFVMLRHILDWLVIESSSIDRYFMANLL